MADSPKDIQWIQPAPKPKAPPEAPPPPDVNTPTLEFAPGWPPILDGTIPNLDSSKPANPESPDSHSAYSVTPNSIREMEAQILLGGPASAGVTGVHAAKDQYDVTRDFVNSTKPWIFERPSEGYTETQIIYDKDNIEHHYTVTIEPSQELKKLTLRMIAIQDNLLLKAADCIQLAGGELVKLLNLAGQLYTRADMDSFFDGT